MSAGEYYFTNNAQKYIKLIKQIQHIFLFYVAYTLLESRVLYASTSRVYLINEINVLKTILILYELFSI